MQSSGKLLGIFSPHTKTPGGEKQESQSWFWWELSLSQFFQGFGMLQHKPCGDFPHPGDPGVKFSSFPRNGSNPTFFSQDEVPILGKAARIQLPFSSPNSTQEKSQRFPCTKTNPRSQLEFFYVGSFPAPLDPQETPREEELSRNFQLGLEFGKPGKRRIKQEWPGGIWD